CVDRDVVRGHPALHAPAAADHDSLVDPVRRPRAVRGSSDRGVHRFRTSGASRTRYSVTSMTTTGSTTANNAHMPIAATNPARTRSTLTSAGLSSVLVFSSRIDSPELRLVAPDGERDSLAVRRPRGLRLVRRLRRDLHGRAAVDRHPEHLKESVSRR